MLRIVCAWGRKGKGPGEGYATKAALIKEANCGQELLELLDEQIVPTRGKRRKVSRGAVF